MDFSKGYSASFYATFVDPYTWLDTGRFEIVSGSIERNTSGLRQSASLTVREWGYDTDVWVRIYMDVNQEGDRAHIPLFTGIASSPSSNFNNGVWDISLQCYSVLKPAEDILMKRGWYALKGSNTGSIIKELLTPTYASVTVGNEATPAPGLSESVVAEDNETNLSMMEYILSLMATEDGTGWRMCIDGMGDITVMPYSDEPVAYISSSYNDVIETSFSVSNDWFECPNVLLISSGDDTYTQRDDSEDSKFSTVNRGREIWEIDNEVAISDTESLASYAIRKLKELQQQTEQISYNRRFLPDVYPDDLIRISYPEIQGDFYIDTQSITLGVNAQTSESISREVE